MHLTLTKKLQKLHRGSRTNKRPDTHSTHFLSGNCQRVGFCQANSHTGRKFRLPLKYLCTAWEDQLIRRDDQGSQIFSDDVLLHGLLAHQALALGITRGPQERAVLPKRPRRRREAAEFERTLMLAQLRLARNDANLKLQIISDRDSLTLLCEFFAEFCVSALRGRQYATKSETARCFSI